MKNIDPTRLKGYLFALIATLAFSNVYIFSKAALNEISLAKFWFYWFLIGAFGSFIIAISQRSFKALKNQPPKSFINFGILGILEIATTSTFFLSINMITNPSITSFIGNMYMVFIIILGVTFLKERFSRVERIGTAITIIGAFMVGYRGGNSLSDYFIKGTGMVILNTFLAATTSIVAKKTIERFNPVIVNLNRTVILFIAATVFLLIKGENLQIPMSALRNTIIGAILGPITAILSVYYSFKYIEASHSSVIQSLKGVFVLIGSILFFRMLPETYQIIGGLISVLGVVIMTIPKSWFKRKHQTSI